MHNKIFYTVHEAGGSGDYKNIVLTPASAQECFDFTQLAFYLAELYRNPVIVMSDAIIGQTRETVEIKKIDFGPLPIKDWAANGKCRHKDGKRHFVEHSAGFTPRYSSYGAFLKSLDKKISKMQAAEIRYEQYKVDDAELIIVAYGYTARVAKEAVNQARIEGMRVGIIRILTAWPFPYDILKEKALLGCKFLVVEDSLGQMFEDVTCAIQGRTESYMVNILDRHLPTDGGMILPSTVIKKIRSIFAGKDQQ